MPDDRFIHKRAGHSEKVNSLNDLEFRVWVQYQLSADDCGVMRYAAIAVQADNDALGARPIKRIQAALDRIVAVGLLHVFQHQDQPFLYQRDWQDFQRVRFPRSTIQPCPPAATLALCTVQTQALFRSRHGAGSEESPSEHRARSEEPPESSGEISEEVPSYARARMANGLRQTANGLRQTANGSARIRGNGSGIGSGVMAGALPREHLRHSFCGRVCVPEFLHGEFRQKLGGEPDSADHRLKSFYELALSEIPSDTPIGDDPIKFWRAHFAAAFGSVAPKSAGHPLGQSMFQPGTSAAELAEGVRQMLAEEKSAK